jgi:hypothetical protein
MMDQSSWFRKKKIGYGGTPNNRKGWAVTSIGILAMVACEVVSRLGTYDPIKYFSRREFVDHSMVTEWICI